MENRCITEDRREGENNTTEQSLLQHHPQYNSSQYKEMMGSDSHSMDLKSCYLLHTLDVLSLSSYTFSVQELQLLNNVSHQTSLTVCGNYKYLWYESHWWFRRAQIETNHGKLQPLFMVLVTTQPIVNPS